MEMTLVPSTNVVVSSSRTLFWPDVEPCGLRIKVLRVISGPAENYVDGPRKFKRTMRCLFEKAYGRERRETERPLQKQRERVLEG
jgi:hypothetical protein